jgi:hypothetical protein
LQMQPFALTHQSFQGSVGHRFLNILPIFQLELAVLPHADVK